MSTAVARPWTIDDFLAWERAQDVSVHGWIYGLHDGLLSDLNVTVSARDTVISSYEAALSLLPATTAA